MQRFPPLRQLLPAHDERNNLALVVYSGPVDLEDCHKARAGGARLGGRVGARPAVQAMAVEEEARADDDAMSLD